MDPKEKEAPPASESPSAELGSVGKALRFLAEAPPRASVEPGPLRPGQLIAGSFRIESPLGGGGMGLVYLARDEALDRAVAIKVQRPGVSGSATERMGREARAMARLAHPNVVQIYEVGEHEGMLFIAMEYVRGGTLKQWLRAQTRKLDEIVAVFEGAGRGLIAAHEIGLVHRDFKPENVLVHASGRAQVADFGLARATGEATASESSTSGSRSKDTLDSRLTETGAVVGTRAYMAPEQHMGRPVDARADQFSFCSALFEAVCGVRPFAGESAGVLLDEIEQGRIREPAAGRDAPPHLLSVIKRGLSADREHRYPSMDALLVDLTWQPRSRWRMAAAGIGVLSVAGAAYGFGVAESPCTAASGQLAAVWSEQTRDDVRAQLGALGKEFADEAFERIDGPLTTYAAQWDAASAEACEARKIREELSTDLYDKQIACLDPLRRRFASFVEELREPDEALALRAVAAAARLGPVEPCTDLEVLRSIDPLPRDPEIRKEVTRLTDALWDFDLEAPGVTLEERRATLESLVQEAIAIGYGPLSARAKLRQTTFDMYHGTGDIDIDTARAALVDAVEARDLAVAGSAAARLTAYYSQREPTEAIHWAAMGHAFLKRTPNPKLRQDLLRDEAFAYSAQGNWEEAERLLQINLAETEGKTPADITLARAYSDLGMIAARQGRNEEGQRYVGLAYQAYKRSRGEHHPLTANSLADTGRFLAEEGKFAEAEAALTDAYDHLVAAYGAEHSHTLWTASALGRVANGRGDWKTAREILAPAVATYKDRKRYRPYAWGFAELQLARALAKDGETDAALALLRETAAGLKDANVPTMAASVLTLQHQLALEEGELDEAKRIAQEAISLAVDKKLPPGDIILAWTTIAEVALARRELEDARASFDKALAASDDPESRLRSGALFGLAKLAAAAGNVGPKALEHAQEALRLAQSGTGAESAEERSRIRAWLERRSVRPAPK